MRKIYIAAPLFSESEKRYNEMICGTLSNNFDVYLPQRDGDLLVDLVQKGMTEHRARKTIFTQDIEAINKSDLLLIVLDGRSIDEGACFELGYAYSREVKCFGIQTDPRRLLNGGNNPMIDEALIRIFQSVSELSEWSNGSNIINMSNK